MGCKRFEVQWSMNRGHDQPRRLPNLRAARLPSPIFSRRLYKKNEDVCHEAVCNANDNQLQTKGPGHVEEII